MTISDRLRSPRFWRMILIGEFSWRRLLRSLLLIYLVLALIGWFAPYRLIFQPPRSSYHQDEHALVMFPAHDGTRLAAFHYPAETGRATIFYTHGNAEDIGLMQPLFEAFHMLGYGVFAYDYRGYGLSEGRPNERNSYADADAAFSWLTNQLGVPPSNIVVLGRSLGAAMAAHVAVTHTPAALILESAFVSAFRVVLRYPPLPFDKFRTIAVAPRIACPVLVIHGTDDWVIRPWHGRRIFNAIRAPKQAWWVEGAGHNDLLMVAGEAYFERLRRFIDGSSTAPP